MIAGALALSRSPLGWPLKWAETFYHELSHGLVCLLTGGQIERIALQFNGAGTCYTRGGWRVPILLAGYTGAALWGGALYMVGWLMSAGGATWWLKLELALLVIVLLLWARDWRTWVILLLLIGLYGATLQLPQAWILPYVLQFMGLYVLLNAVRAPLHLIDGEANGDGADLSRILWVPEGVWIALWFGWSMAVLAACMLATLPALLPVARWLGW